MNKIIIPYLTHKRDSLILSPLLPHEAIGIENPRQGDKTPLSTVAFLCPVIINTGLIRIKSFMVGCIEQPLKRLAVPLSGILNLIQSTAQELRIKSGGLFLRQGDKS